MVICAPTERPLTNRSYFLWDALDATINFDDIGFLVHGKSFLKFRQP